MKTSSTTRKVLITVGVLGAAWIVWKTAQTKRSSSPLQHLVGQEASSRRVREAQRLLSKLGYTLSVTGIDGPRTREAVKQFQSLHDLDIDGVVNFRTLAALRAEVAATSSQPFTGFGPMASGALTPNMIGSG